MKKHRRHFGKLIAAKARSIIQPRHTVAVRRVNGENNTHRLVMQALKFSDIIFAVINTELPEYVGVRVARQAPFQIVIISGRKHIALGIHRVDTRLGNKAAIGFKAAE